MTAAEAATAAAPPSPPPPARPPRAFRLIPGQDLPSFELTPAAVAEIAPRHASTLVRRGKEGGERKCYLFYYQSAGRPLAAPT